MLRIGRERRAPYYLLNLRHPTIRALYDRWRKDHGGPTVAPGDLERITWELSLMSQETQVVIQAHFEAVDEMERNLKGESQ